MIIRAILPQWAQKKFPGMPRAVEGDFNEEEIKELNESFYNIYFFPNSPSLYDPHKKVSGADIDTFDWVFVDFDLKSKTYESKEEFLVALLEGIEPTRLVDTGNGIHAYWKVQDLDAKSYLRLCRRAMRRFNTDPAVGTLNQLMRVPSTTNTKKEEDLKPAIELDYNDRTYTAEELDKALPPITQEDEEFCTRHYNMVHNPNASITKVDEKLPNKFGKLLSTNREVKDIWGGRVDDRSKGDYRLGHIMFANEFTRDEAMSVLVNSAKALGRAPQHRVAYAENIVDKIWTFEETKDSLDLSSSVKDILIKAPAGLKGTRFPCHTYIDATQHGFRLGQVIGLVAGSGVGKTAMALNMFMGFVQNNPDHVHFFVPLEQPAHEIADRWKTMCGNRTELHDKVEVISNYADDGSFRHLSFDEIRQYILKYQKIRGVKAGCVVIDHIGALKKKTADGENQGLMDICHSMKAFATQTQTMLVMQSQAPREKAGIGDLELNKDAAYGTVYFESYCDYLISIWQPLKRCYTMDKCPTVTAFKFCKIRHKKQGQDRISEDVCYRLFFDPAKEHLRELTEAEEKSFDYFNKQSATKRKQDRKTDVLTYRSIPWTKEVDSGKADSSQNSSGS